ncbi:MAG TPA: hypothetical protein VMD02_00850 [Candidatus Omnitrophota bacterium]|nr:hypothetical protein [Candidatus Omnitrophota bacterium]
MKKYVLIVVLIGLASASAFSANVKMILDSSDGSSALSIQDKTSKEVARVDSSGRVGIGTTAPLYGLDVSTTLTRGINSVSNAYGGYGVYGTASDTSAVGPNYGVYGSAAANFNGSAGVYGVATGSPSQVYGVYGSAGGLSGRGVFGTESGGGYGGYFLNSSSGVGLYAASTSGYAAVFPSGNVGVGTASPSNLLTLQGSATPQLMITQPSATDALTLGYNEASYAYMATLGSHPLALFTNNLERLRVTSAGNVGIGTTGPGEKLEIVGNAKITSLSTSSNVTMSNAITAAGNYGLSVIIDGVERGSVDRLGNGYLSNTLTLASVAAPTAATGKIYFDSTVHRLKYYDSTKWIEMDPAYTNNSLQSTPMYSVSGTNTANMSMLTPGTDIIITGIAGNTDWLTNQCPEYLIELYNGSTSYVSIYVPDDRGDYEYSLPIPVRVPSGTAISARITAKDYTGANYLGTYATLRCTMRYIALPL